MKKPVREKVQLAEARAEVVRLRADNAAMFKNLEEQTARGLQMVGKWQQAETKLRAVAEILRRIDAALAAVKETPDPAAERDCFTEAGRGQLREHAE